MKALFHHDIGFVSRQVLMSAYLYYQRDRSVLTDSENDKNVRVLLAYWKDVPDRYKALIALPDDGSLTTFNCKYTRLVEGGALSWLAETTGEIIQPLYHGYYTM